MPASHIDIQPPKNLDQYVGQTYDFKVLKINLDRKNIVLSRRELIEQQKQLEELVNDLADVFLTDYKPTHERRAVSGYNHYFLGSIIVDIAVEQHGTQIARSIPILPQAGAFQVHAVGLAVLPSNPAGPAPG